MLKLRDHTSQMLIATKSGKINISEEKDTKSVAEKFSKLVKNGDFILLSGNLGIGKTTFALHFINYLFSKNEITKYNLQENIINSESLSFKFINNYSHPNFYFISKNDGKKNIEVDQIRQMINFLNKSSFNNDKKVIFIRGVMEDVQTKETQGNLTIYNFLTGEELENAFNQSETILSRSGYTTLMDLAKLKKKAFFIPTPGQTEQVYLAKRLQEKGIAPSCKQHQFSLKKLEEIELYKGLSFDSSVFEWRDMFSLF